MKITELRWTLVALLIVWLVWAFISSSPTKSGVYMSANYEDHQYWLSVATDPAELGCAVLLLMLYLVLLKGRVGAKEEKPLRGVFRRLVAFWIDILAMFLLVEPLLAIVTLLSESVKTGEFQWNLERTTSSRGGGFEVGLLWLISCVLPVLYFAIPLVFQRPTPGTCVMGYRIAPDSGKNVTLTRAVLRSLLGFFAVCTAWAAPFIGRDRERGKFWLDKVFSTHAVTLS